MISKGVDYYAYISTTPFSVEFQSPSDWGKQVTRVECTTAGEMMTGNLQITEDDIGVLDHTGRFEWDVLYNSNNLAGRYAQIAPSTGDLGDTNMGNMLQTPSMIGLDYAISYGFYDAGAGWGSLTNQDQSYVYVTDNYSNWMGDLGKSMPSILDKPFSTFALVGAHDSGMFDVTCLNSMLTNATFLGMLGGLAGVILADQSAEFAQRVAIDLAFTQKDNFWTMLDLGVRYFDFRPGYCFPTVPDRNLYHQHQFIPGYPYASFLNDVLSWLLTHPDEIVVISANFQGFEVDSSVMEPSPDVLQTYLNDALTASNAAGSIVPGDKSDLDTSYKDLLTAKKRLIFLNQVKASNDAVKYDSYSSSLYQTTDVTSILAALDGMSKSGQEGHNYTVLQLQGTANATGGGIFTSIATTSNASSPILSTKAAFDHSTYPWLKDNVATRLNNDQLVVFLNDFADNALVHHAIEVTKQRAG